MYFGICKIAENNKKHIIMEMKCEINIYKLFSLSDTPSVFFAASSASHIQLTLSSVILATSESCSKILLIVEIRLVQNKTNYSYFHKKRNVSFEKPFFSAIFHTHENQ
jgi:hypothetical protein